MSVENKSFSRKNPVRDDMSVENKSFSGKNPVGDDMSVEKQIVLPKESRRDDMSVEKQIVRPKEGLSRKPPIRHCEERSNPEIADNYWIASSFLLAMTTGCGFRDAPDMSVEKQIVRPKESRRDDMSVENDMSAGRHTGIIPDGIPYRIRNIFYRHSVLDGTHKPAIMRSSLVDLISDEQTKENDKGAQSNSVTDNYLGVPDVSARPLPAHQIDAIAGVVRNSQFSILNSQFNKFNRITSFIFIKIISYV
jgi:hypothetical protein